MYTWFLNNADEICLDLRAEKVMPILFEMRKRFLENKVFSYFINYIHIIAYAFSPFRCARGTEGFFVFALCFSSVLLLHSCSIFANRCINAFDSNIFPKLTQDMKFSHKEYIYY